MSQYRGEIIDNLEFERRKGQHIKQKSTDQKVGVCLTKR